MTQNKHKIHRKILTFFGVLGIAGSVFFSTEKVQATEIPRAYANELSYITEKYPGTKSQDLRSTCWAFSAIGLAEYDLIEEDKVEDATVDFSEMALSYATYNRPVDPMGLTEGDSYKMLQDGSYLDYGGNLEYAIRILTQGIGPIPEQEIPYPDEAKALEYSDELFYEKSNVQLKDVRKIRMLDEPQLVKEAIMKHGAVGISYYSPETVGEAEQYIGQLTYLGETVPVQYCSDKKASNHAVNVIGWDDDFPMTAFGHSVPGNGAWLIRNSWSTNNKYEEGSYFWLSYYDKGIDNVAWVLDFSKEKNYEHIYQYDGCIVTVDGSVVIEQMRFDAVANVFEVSEDENESLNAVSFSCLFKEDVEYTIQIYTDLWDASNPYSGIKRASISGATTHAGYYTIPLEETISLRKDTNYAVVIRFKEPGSVDTEYSLSHRESPIRSVASMDWGQSLYYKNGKWKDLWDSYKSVGIGNFCIKAFTSKLEGSVPTQVRSAYEKRVTKNSVTLAWRAVKNATLYEIYRADSSKGSYQLVGTLKAGKKILYTDKNLKKNKTYYYRIRAVQKKDGKELVGKTSLRLTVKTKKK